MKKLKMFVLFVYQNYYKPYRELVNYLIAGVIDLTVELGVYYLLIFTVLNPDNAVQLQAANVIAWAISVTVAFFINRSFVFQSKSPHIIQEAAKFYAARIITLLLDMGLMFLLCTLLGFNPRFAKLGVKAVVIVANYLFSKFIVFRQKG